MSLSRLKTLLMIVLLAGITLHPDMSQAAGGIVLSNTRIIYPAGQKQASITVRNISKDSRYLVQSWAEDELGNKTAAFIVTPPLYVSNPGTENTLRMMYTGSLPAAHHETLYYLTAKAIPAVDKSKTEGRNVLMLAAATRIKLIVRPQGLRPTPEKAPEMLSVSRSGRQVTLKNPTPYYLTLVQMKTGNQSLNSVMVPPLGEHRLTLPAGHADSLHFRVMNDYGGMTDELVRTF